MKQTNKQANKQTNKNGVNKRELHCLRTGDQRRKPKVDKLRNNIKGTTVIDVDNLAQVDSVGLESLHG